MCRWAPLSFGLQPKDKSYILEEIFLLMEYCNVSWLEAWDIPISYRKWLIERKRKENEKRNEHANKGKQSPKPTPKAKSKAK